MKKTVVIFSMLLCMPAFVCCEKDHIEKVNDVCTKMEDINFKQYCYDNFDVNKDGVVSMDEASTVFHIDIRERKIYSLKGLEYFPQLTVLHASYNQLSSIDVSRNTQLNELYCYDNNLTSLNVSNNIKLTKLSCSVNALKSLDISKNTQLTALYCAGCLLTSIDVSNNNQLRTLDCSENCLKTIDISCLPNLDRSVGMGWDYFGHQYEEGTDKWMEITIYDKAEYWVGIGTPGDYGLTKWILQ